jgi:hypothetical protein
MARAAIGVRAVVKGGDWEPSRLFNGRSKGGTLGVSVMVVAAGESTKGGGARRGLGLSVVVVTRLPKEEMRFLTLENVRPMTVRDFMATGNIRVVRPAWSTAKAKELAANEVDEPTRRCASGVEEGAMKKRW